LLLVITVLVVTGLMTAWFASRAIARRFENYVAQNTAAGLAQREQMLRDLPPLLEGAAARTGELAGAAGLARQFSALSGERILLFDPRGRTLFDSADEQNAETPPGGPEMLQTALTLEGTPIGTLGIAATVAKQPSASQQEFINSMNLALALAIASAGVIALLLTLVWTRSILRPVEALTAAVNRMKTGDLQQRVEAASGDEIGELGRAFNRMADSLAHAEQVRRNMVSDVAHELRTPLSNIRGYLEAMQDGLVQPGAEVVDSLHEETLLLGRLVDDLQLLALADAGHLPLAPEMVAIGDIVEQAVQAANHLVNGSGIQFDAEVASDLPAVRADPERLGQVLRNLLNNAFAYTPSGGQIDVRARNVSDGVEISVFNTGQGIAPEHLPHLFDRFYRVDRSRTRATGGSGLGLAIVKQLVEAHGGRVWAESQVGEWARFTFSLPAAPRPVAGDD
jgi:signal transduction histidine kinase